MCIPLKKTPFIIFCALRNNLEKLCNLARLKKKPNTFLKKNNAINFEIIFISVIGTDEGSDEVNRLLDFDILTLFSLLLGIFKNGIVIK